MSPKITVKSITAVKDEPYVTVYVELVGEKTERIRYIISADEYKNQKLKRGEIGVEALENLKVAAKNCEALRRGEYLLGYGANSVRMMQRKLRSKGFDDETASYAAQELEKRGYIDEEKDALTAMRRCISKLWGARKILVYLYGKGYGEEAIKSVQRELSKIDFSQACRKVIEKKYGEIPTEREEWQKMTAALMRLGFSISDIRKATESHDDVD